MLFFLAVIFLYMQPFNKPIFNSSMMRGVACFYEGALLCELNDRLDADKKNSLSWKSLILLIIFRVCLHFSEYSFWENEKYGQLGLILIEWPILLFSVINWKPLRNIMDTKPFVKMGNISMHVFLWHIPVQITIKIIDKIWNIKIDYGKIYIWIIYIVSVLIVANISFFIFQNRNRRSNYFVEGIIAIVCCVVAFFITDLTGVRLKETLGNSLTYNNYAATIMMEPGTKVSEDFKVKKDTKINCIQFYAITWDKKFSENQLIQVTLYDEEISRELYTVTKKISQLKDANVYNIMVDEDILLLEEHQYRIEFKTNTEEKQEVMALMMTNVSENSKQAYINDKESKYHISAEILTRKY